MWIDGSKEQIDALKAEAVETGEMIKLNEEILRELANPSVFRIYITFAVHTAYPVI